MQFFIPYAPGYYKWILMGVVVRYWQDVLNLESPRYHEAKTLETTSLKLILLRKKNKWNVKLVQFRNISYNLQILEHDLRRYNYGDCGNAI